MSQVDFVYALAADSVGLPLAVSVFSDRDLICRDMRDDVERAGLSLSNCSALALVQDHSPNTLGELILVDCPDEEPAALAALCSIDARAAVTGARLIVSASLNSLDAVFGCCTESAPQILVGNSRTERMIALGRAMAGLPSLRLREMSDDDRLALLRLTQQVSEMAQKLELIGNSAIVDRRQGEGDALHSAGVIDTVRSDGRGDRLVRATRPPLPDPRLVRKIIQQRQLRARFFDGDLFADPAWDMLLDLTAARVEHVRVSVTSLCIASGVPPTTALRWISQMSDAGLLERLEDETDRRRAFIQLTDRAVEAMARYFHELGKSAASMV